MVWYSAGYSKLQKVGIWISGDLCWCSFFRLFCHQRVIFQLSGVYCRVLFFFWSCILGLLFWLFKGGFKVSSGTVDWYRNSYGTDFDYSEIASPGIAVLPNLRGKMCLKGFAGSSKERPEANELHQEQGSDTIISKKFSASPEVSLHPSRGQARRRPHSMGALVFSSREAVE